MPVTLMLSKHTYPMLTIRHAPSFPILTQSWTPALYDEKHLQSGVKWNIAPESTTHVISCWQGVAQSLQDEQKLLFTCRYCQCASSLQNLLRFATFTSSFLFLEVLTILLEVPCLPPMETSGPAPRLRSHPRLMPVQRTSIRPLPRFVSPSMIKSFRSVQDSLSFVCFSHACAQWWEWL